MTIDVVSAVDGREWDDLVEADKNSTFFHTYDWGDVVENTLPGWRRFYVLVRGNGTLVGALPGFRRRLGGLSRIVSMPFGTFGGPAVAPGSGSNVVAASVEAFFGLASSARVVAAHMVDYSGRIAAPPRGVKTSAGEMQVLKLDRPYEELWEGFKPSNRNKIRKARKAGVVVRRAVGETDFLEYYRLLLDCHRRWGTPPVLGEGFFAALSRLSEDAVRMWLAEHEGKMVGGLLNFGHQDHVLNWGNVSSSGAWKLSPNNILHATAIEQAIGDGFALYNFGSSAGLSGVDAFKAAFRTVRVPFRSYHLEKLWYRTARAVGGARGLAGKVLNPRGARSTGAGQSPSANVDAEAR